MSPAFLGLLSLMLISAPWRVHAGVFSVVLAELVQVFEQKKTNTGDVSYNSQNIAILQASRAIDSDFAKGGGDITVVGAALEPETGPVGTMADIEEGMLNETISTYVVRKGDTVGSIAKMFGVTTNTVRWANDISGSIIREGQVLVILPITGVRHTVANGDTISKIAKKYKADAEEVAYFNNMNLSHKLEVGSIVIVPDGEIASPVTRSTSVRGNPLRGGGGPIYEGYYLRPVLGGKKTQGLHGYNGVDIGTYSGAPVFAAAEGDVIISARGGWNGGYGNYIVITHANGTQTLYSHLSGNLVAAGDHVVRGAQIGLVGSTGKSTGPHLHFEVRGASNPF